MMKGIFMMKLGKLTFEPAANHIDLVSTSVKKLATEDDSILVAEIDPSLSDTAAFCEHYGIGMEQSANCVIVEAKRAERTWYAACIVLATTRADINGIVRRHLDARRVSFAPVDKAVEMTGMAFGAITPIGLPDDIPILIDTQVTQTDYVVVGSGVRESKLLVKPEVLTKLPNAVVMDIVKA